MRETDGRIVLAVGLTGFAARGACVEFCLRFSDAGSHCCGVKLGVARPDQTPHLAGPAHSAQIRHPGFPSGR